jgi:hypothetical protein
LENVITFAWWGVWGESKILKNKERGAKTMKKSIFEFGDKFGLESPFGDWVGEMKQNNEDLKNLEASVNSKYGENSYYVRLHFYGGAKSSSDNSAFYFAMLNVVKDYENDGLILKDFAKTGKYIVGYINLLKENTIQSIDIFTHGSQYALYMVRNKETKESGSTRTDLVKDKIESNNLYTSKSVRATQSWFNGDQEDVINSINFSVFTESSKIEIHGCNTAGSTYAADNLVINLSEMLYSADKKRAVVIGHDTKANPLINGAPVFDKNKKQTGGTTVDQQDYRHGSRIVYHNGKVLFSTKIKGRIKGNVIKHYLNKKEHDGKKYKPEEYTIETEITK